MGGGDYGVEESWDCSNVSDMSNMFSNIPYNESQVGKPNYIILTTNGTTQKNLVYTNFSCIDKKKLNNIIKILNEALSTSPTIPTNLDPDLKAYLKRVGELTLLSLLGGNNIDELRTAIELRNWVFPQDKLSITCQNP